MPLPAHIIERARAGGREEADLLVMEDEEEFYNPWGDDDDEEEAGATPWIIGGLISLAGVVALVFLRRKPRVPAPQAPAGAAAWGRRARR